MDTSDEMPGSFPVNGHDTRNGDNNDDELVERSKYIPLRLTFEERKYLRLLDSALQVSEYTDVVDVLSFRNSKTTRIVQQIRELCAILSGLVLAADYKQVRYLQSRDLFFR